ncbi:MAG: M13 family metallopeptidase [Salinivirgaceae bacterium]|nr:M13 family metallopeptidase [Salinivirgaceae bacterium]
MKNPSLIALSLLTFGLLGCSTNMENNAIDTKNLDLSANPAQDFNQYANGGWMKNNPIPEDKASYNTFTELRDENEKKVRSIVDELLSQEFKTGTVERKIGDMFKTGMDSVALNSAGFTPLIPYFKQIDAINNLQDLQQLTVKLRVDGISTMFSFYGSPDRMNSDLQIAQLHQGGYKLGNRDYYFENDDRTIEIRTEYQKHISRQFQNTGVDDEVADKAAQVVVNLETKLASKAYTNTEMRDPIRSYNKMEMTEVQKLAPDFNFNSFFQHIGLADLKELNVGNPAFFQNFNSVLVNTPIDDWKWFLKWNIITTNANYLSDNLINEDFDFYGKTMSGSEKIRPRWKRVLGSVNSTLDEAIGQIYVKKFFPPESKERMLELVGNLKEAFGERMAKLEWMSEETKEKALDKLSSINVKIGYPDTWKDYTSLEIKHDSYFTNITRARRWFFQDMISKINKPVDKTEWAMSPQTVNAYYHPLNNEIAFPAAILQPPFFFADADDAVNYGAIGVVIGHEMTHGFDDKGRMFDKHGNMTIWWTDEDKSRFEERTKLLVDQFNNVNVLDSLNANGEYSLGENIADLGGLSISYTAFSKTQQFKDGGKIKDFTPQQRFFLAYGHVWAQNLREKEMVRLTKEDVHSLGKNRTNEPLRTLPAFHEAFNVNEGDYMYMPVELRATIW